MGKRKKQPEGKKGLDEWLGTYADMITLLFCFFVLLYATSTQDEVKLQYILQSVSTGGEFINVVVDHTNQAVDGDGIENSELPPLDEGTGGSGGKVVSVGQGNEPDTFEVLFNWISKAVADAEMEESMTVDGSKNRISICLDNDVLFDPNSATLKPSGRDRLRLIVPAVKATEKYISSIQIIGHTADVQGVVSTVNDWDLSALRASAVLKYFDYERMVDSGKMKLEAFAQYRPIADNSTEEGRAKNRRVEIIINRNPVEFLDGDLMEDILRFDYNNSLSMVDDDGNPIAAPTPSLDSTINAIISEIQKKYSSDEGSGGESTSQPVGPQVGNSMLDIPESDYIPEETEEGEVSEGSSGTDTEATGGTEENSG